MIWKSIPSQLARENKKFIYKVVKAKVHEPVSTRMPVPAGRCPLGV